VRLLASRREVLLEFVRPVDIRGNFRAVRVAHFVCRVSFSARVE